MSFSDKTLVCVECGNGFVFTESEQEFYSSKGFVNEPKRCPDCREARKQRGGGQGGSLTGYSSYQRPREMFSVVCAACGKETQVPFQPRNGRPVYCSDCFAQNRR